MEAIWLSDFQVVSVVRQVSHFHCNFSSSSIRSINLQRRSVKTETPFLLGLDTGWKQVAVLLFRVFKGLAGSRKFSI